MLAFSVLLETHCISKVFQPLAALELRTLLASFFCVTSFRVQPAISACDFSLGFQPGISAWDFSLNAGLPQIPEIPILVFESCL
jgi:hypothetical protein